MSKKNQKKTHRREGCLTPFIFTIAFVVAIVILIATSILGSDSPSERVKKQQECRPEIPASGWTIPIGEEYTITGDFGPRTSPITGRSDFHTGIDLASASQHAPILAASSGTIARLENLGNRSYGQWIEIDHGNGTTTRYAHLRNTKVHVGDQVTTGQEIATEGESGGVTGPHLHFEVRHDGTATNPVTDYETHNLTFDGKPGTTNSNNNSNTGTGTNRATAPEEIAEFLPHPSGVDQSATLTNKQITMATTIVETGQKLGLPPRAWAIALITALQESTLGADNSTTTPNEDTDVGVFQQRAKVGWYADGLSVEQNTEILNDLIYAATTFYQGHDVGIAAPDAAGPIGYHIPGLIDIQGWDSMPLWQAAQKVQVSAFPLYYAKHEATVASLLPKLTINTTDRCNPTNKIPTPDGTTGEKVAAYATTQLGVPYSWGGGDATGPTKGFCCSPGGQDGSTITGFDCSGLALWAWAQVGAKLPHQSDQQQKLITPIQTNEIQAGDLLFFPGHVGIADGHGGMIEAPRPGQPVRITPNILTDTYYGPRFTGAGHPTPETGN